MAREYPELEKQFKDLPRHFLIGFRLGSKVRLKKGKISRIIFCGMGGSALPGLVLNPWLQRLKQPVPVIIWRDYGLPPLKKGDLIIASSYSGNTEETLNSFNEAIKKHAAILVITSGGALEKLANAKKIPVIIIPSGLVPRFALGYFTGALLGSLTQLRLIPSPQRELKNVARRIRQGPSIKEAKRLARLFENKIPLIYTTDSWRTLGHIWKISLNETAKSPAFHYILPELDHNELQGWTTKPSRYNQSFAALFLKDKPINPRLDKRFTLTRRFFISKGKIKSTEFVLRGKNFWEKMISGTLLANWTSYFLALKRGVDPTDDRVIEEFKKLMK